MTTTERKVVIDLDDFGEDHEANALNWLFEIKAKYPNFKATLFTIYKHCSRFFLELISEIGWLELAAHGYYHKSNDEVLKWDKKTWYDVLNTYERSRHFVKGFKAPNWEMSKLGYHVLAELGWWVAVREHQIKDLPFGIKYYCFETNPGGVHGHTWTMGAHKQEGKFDWNWKHDPIFEFISSNLEVKK